MPNPPVEAPAVLARREHDMYERRGDSLDTKAGLVLGFAGLLVSVTPPELSDVLVLVVRALAAAAAMLALGAFGTRLPTAYEWAPRSRRPEAAVVVEALKVNSIAAARVAGKTRRIHASLRLLGAALATIVAGTMTAVVLDLVR